MKPHRSNSFAVDSKPEAMDKLERRIIQLKVRRTALSPKKKDEAIITF